MNRSAGHESGTEDFVPRKQRVRRGSGAAVKSVAKPNGGASETEPISKVRRFYRPASGVAVPTF